MAGTSDVTIRLSAEGREQVIAALRSIGPEGEAMARRVERAGEEASRGLLAINAASGAVRDKARELAGGLGPIGGVLLALGPAGAAAAVGLATLALGLGKAFDKAREGMEFADSINTASRTLGVGIEALQEYRAAMVVTGDETANFDVLMSSLLEKMGEFDRTGGGGKAGPAFKALGLSVRDANGEMKTGQEMLEEIIAKVSALGSEAQKADISKKLFGDQAQNFLALIQNGSAGVDELREKMRAMGVVMDAEVVRRYAQASEESKILSQAIDVQLMSAFVDFAPILNDAAALWRDFAKAVGWARDNIVDIERKSTERLEATLSTLTARRDFLSALIRDGQTPSLDDLAKLGMPRGANVGAIVGDLDKQIAEIQRVLDARKKITEQHPETSVETLGSGISDAAQRDIETIEKLKQSLATFGDERQKYIDNALGGLSKDATQGQREQMAQLAGQLYDMTQLTRDAADEQERLNKQRREHDQIMQGMLTDGEKYTAQQQYLNEKLADGTLNQSEYDRALAKAREQYDPATRGLKQMSDGLADASIGFLSAVGSAHSAGDALRDFAQRALEALLQIIAWQPIQSAISGGLSSLFGGSFGSSLFGSHHSGGMVGTAAPSRNIATAAFAVAPRFHQGGLLPGEVPIVAQRGEGIFTPRQMDNADAIFRTLAGSPSREGPINVKIVKNADRDDVKARRGSDGALNLDVMVSQVEAKIGANVGTGRSPINAAMETRYGVKPKFQR